MRPISSQPEGSEPAPESARRGSLAGAAALLTLGSLFTQAASIVTLSLLARLVAKPEIGTYQQLYLLYGLISPLLLAGLPAGLLYFIPQARTERERRDLVASSYALLSLLGLVAAVLVLVLRHPLADLLGNPRLGTDLALFSPYLLFAFVAAPTPNALVAGGRPAAAGLINAAGGAFVLLAVIGAALIQPDARALAVGLSSAAGAWALLSLVVVHRTVGISRRPGRLGGTWRRLLGYGLPLAFTGLAGQLGYQFDRLVVSARYSAADFAVYALGTIEVPIAILLQQAVTNVMVPALSTRWRAGDVAGMIELWRESIRKTSLVILPMFAFLMVLAPEAVRVLYGSGYDRSVQLFRIYLTMLPVRVATFGLIPQAIGKTRINLVAGFLVLTLNAVVVLSLVGPLGLTGPALALPVATAATVVYYLVRLRRILHARVRDMLPLRRLAGIGAVSALCAAAVAPLGLLGLAPGLHLVLAGVIFSGLCAGGLWVSGELNDDDRLRLVRLARSRFGRAS